MFLSTLMAAVCRHFYNNRPRKGGCWGQWGAFILMVSATLLLLLAPLKNLITHACMESFKLHGFTPVIGYMLDIAYRPCLSTRLLQVYTGVAYALMLWSIAMQLDMTSKARAMYAACFLGADSNAAGKEDTRQPKTCDETS
jgi:hypothetical protein